MLKLKKKKKVKKFFFFFSIFFLYRQVFSREMKKRVLESSSNESSITDQRLRTPAALKNAPPPGPARPPPPPLPTHSLMEEEHVFAHPGELDDAYHFQQADENAHQQQQDLDEDEDLQERKRAYKTPVPRGTLVEREIAELQQDQVCRGKQKNRVQSCISIPQIFKRKELLPRFLLLEQSETFP